MNCYNVNALQELWLFLDFGKKCKHLLKCKLNYCFILFQWHFSYKQITLFFWQERGLLATKWHWLRLFLFHQCTCQCFPTVREGCRYPGDYSAKSHWPKDFDRTLSHRGMNLRYLCWKFKKKLQVNFKAHPGDIWHKFVTHSEVDPEFQTHLIPHGDPTLFCSGRKHW